MHQALPFQSRSWRSTTPSRRSAVMARAAATKPLKFSKYQGLGNDFILVGGLKKASIRVAAAGRAGRQGWLLPRSALGATPADGCANACFDKRRVAFACCHSLLRFQVVRGDDRG